MIPRARRPAEAANVGFEAGGHDKVARVAAAARVVRRVVRDVEGVADLVGDGVRQSEAVVLVDGARAAARFADGAQLGCEFDENV